MAGESLLQQAFAETGVQLDRIIDAYERTPASDPNYPRVLAFSYDYADDTMGRQVQYVKIYENLSCETLPQSHFEWLKCGAFKNNDSNEISIYVDTSDDMIIDPSDDLLAITYNATTFEITQIATDDDVWNPRWVNESDIPQS